MSGGKKAGLKYTSCYLLAAMSGKGVSADSMKAIFEAGGMDFEQDMIQMVLSKMEGKNLNEVMTAGTIII